MHRTPRSNPFNDLLPDVAALGEIQRPLLTSFLGEIALPDVLPKLRYAAYNSKRLKCIRMDFLCAGFYQSTPDPFGALRRDPNLVTGGSGIVAANQRSLRPVPFHALEPEAAPSLSLRSLEIQSGDRSIKHGAGFWPRHSNNGNLPSQVLDLDIIHNDVAVENLQHSLHLRSLRLHDQAFSAIECIQIRLNL